MDDNGSACGDGVSHRVFAVAVTFNPDIVTFDSLLAETCDQVEQILVLDNGSQDECIAQLVRICAGRATLHRLPFNAGIASAQNQGFELARKAGATDVLLLDHDSIPGCGMVAALCAGRELMREAGETVAAVGPLVIDRHIQTAAPIPQVLEDRVRFVVPSEAEPSRCEFLIASGTLIALEAFDEVGPMNEEYFIDQVDVEWCLRARARGLNIYCIPDARLCHAIGDDVVHFWAFGWRQLAVHTPMRDYFYFRNSVRLIFSSHATAPWRRFWGRRLLRLFFVQTVFVRPRWRRFRAMTSGTCAAVFERLRSGGI